MTATTLDRTALAGTAPDSTATDTRPTGPRPTGEDWQAADGAAEVDDAVLVAAEPDPRPLERVASGLPRPRRPRPPVTDDEGSLVTEYGLIAILGATAVSLVLRFLSGGALFELFGSILGKVRALVGA